MIYIKSERNTMASSLRSKQFDMCLRTPGWKSREFSLSIRLSMALLVGLTAEPIHNDDAHNADDGHGGEDKGEGEGLGFHAVF